MNLYGFELHNLHKYFSALGNIYPKDISIERKAGILCHVESKQTLPVAGLAILRRASIQYLNDLQYYVYHGCFYKARTYSQHMMTIDQMKLEICNIQELIKYLSK